MQMDKGMDTGDVIDIQRTPIGADETYGELQDRLAVIAADLALHWMPSIVAGTYARNPQNGDAATLAPKIEKAEAELAFDRNARGEYNRFRAFTPAPGAFIRTAQGLLRLSSVRHSNVQGEPGVILGASPLTVGFADGALEFCEVQPEGKKRMSGKDFANGARLRPGSRLS